MKYLHTLVALLFAGTLAGCAHGANSKLAEMQVKIDALNAEVEELESDLDESTANFKDMCFAAFEISSMGTVIYLGDGYWHDLMMGKTMEIPESDKMCAEVLGLYREELSTNKQRSDLLRKHKASLPPVNE